MKKIITLLFMLAMLATSASAAYDIDIDNDTITISGTTAPNSSVIVAILKPGDITTQVNADKIADKPFFTDVKVRVDTLLSGGDSTIEDDFEKYKKHFQHVTAGADGAYELDLPVVQDSTYDVAYLLVEGYDNVAEGTIIYVPSAETETDAKNVIDGALTSTLIANAIDTYDFVFGLDTSSSVYGELKNEIAAAIIKMKAQNSVSTFASFSDVNNPNSFKSYFNKALAYYTRQKDAMNAINMPSLTEDGLKIALETYAQSENVLGAYGGEKLNFVAAYNTYGYMDINKELVGKSYAKMTDFIEAFKGVVNRLAENAANPEEGTINNPTRPQGPTDDNGGGGNGFGAMYVPTAQPPAVEEDTGGLNDLDQAPWAKESILNLVSRGIVNGMGDGTFNPNGNVTREQFVKMLLISFNFQPTATSGTLSDVDNGAWYAPYVNTACELGIVNGVSNTEFGVGMNITRQDLVTMIMRACEVYGLKVSKTQSVSFTDESEIAGYAYDAVIDLASAGVINGVTEGVFAPAQNATRAQVSVILDRLYNI